MGKFRVILGEQVIFRIAARDWIGIALNELRSLKKRIPQWIHVL